MTSLVFPAFIGSGSLKRLESHLFAAVQWSGAPPLLDHPACLATFATVAVILYENDVAESKAPRTPADVYGPEHFTKVADVYRAHLAAGGRVPTKAVAERFMTTKSTAAEWVARARSDGLFDE